MVVIDFKFQRILNEEDIQSFLRFNYSGHNETLHDWVKAFYWTYVWFVYYGIYASVLACASSTV